MFEYYCWNSLSYRLTNRICDGRFIGIHGSAVDGNSNFPVCINSMNSTIMADFCAKPWVAGTWENLDI